MLQILVNIYIVAVFLCFFLIIISIKETLSLFKKRYHLEAFDMSLMEMALKTWGKVFLISFLPGVNIAIILGILLYSSDIIPKIVKDYDNDETVIRIQRLQKLQEERENGKKE